MNVTYRRSYHGPVRLAVFDWAGTTVDFGCRAPLAAFIEGFRARGLEVDLEIARAPMGMEKRDHIRTVAHHPDVFEAWKNVHGREVSETDIDTMFDDFVPRLLTILEDYSQLIPGVVEAVSELRRRGLKIGATTGYFTEAAEITAAAGARAGYCPDYTTCASEVSQGRPSPWMIYRVMEALSICPPEAVIKIGDTAVDIEAGLNAGTWAIGVTETGNDMGLSREELDGLAPEERQRRREAINRKFLQAGAHYVIASLDELPPLVDAINVRLERGEKP